MSRALLSAAARRFCKAGLAALAGGIFVSAAIAQPAPTSQTIELRNGQYWETVKNPSTAPVTDEVLDRIAQLVENNSNSAAKKLAVSWLKRETLSPLRDRALYLLGLANYQYGDRIAAFYNFDELMDKYPESRYFYPALDKQYQIADAYLSGYKRRFLGIPMLSAEDEAVEMLFRIQQRSPGSPLAEKSLKRTADYYYADAQYDIAVDAYQAFIDRYRRSPDIPQVRLKKAFAELAQFHGIKFDATPAINARTSLEEIAIDYPELARQENVAAVIDRIDAALARKIYSIAQFYIRTHELRAAAYNFKYLMLNYPTSPEAAKAKEDLARLPASARDVPGPTTKPFDFNLDPTKGTLTPPPEQK